MADEYFRGSYIQGYMANGELTDTLDYKVALAGNLSALGVSASQLDQLSVYGHQHALLDADHR